MLPGGDIKIRKGLHGLSRPRDNPSRTSVAALLIGQDALSIQFIAADGRSYVPATWLGGVMLGPETCPTYEAVQALADNGRSIVWTGENSIGGWAYRMREARSLCCLPKQGELVCEQSGTEVVCRVDMMHFR